MEWNFMGKGSAFYPPFGNTGAYMLLEKELYLLDVGRGHLTICTICGSGSGEHAI